MLNYASQRARTTPSIVGLLVTVVLMLGLLTPHAALAQTTVGGTIGANTTWTTTGSPYLVTSDITIENGATLEIDAGVEVRFGAGLGLTVGVGATSTGTLDVNGTAADPVEFVSDAGTPAAGDWLGLVFTTHDAGSTIEHATVRHAGGGAANTGAIQINYATPTLTSVAVLDSGRSGVRAFASSGQSLSFTDVRVEDSAADGFLMTGGTDHVLTRPVALDNASRGIAVAAASGVEIIAVVARGNDGAGQVRVASCTDVSIAVDAIDGLASQPRPGITIVSSPETLVTGPNPSTTDRGTIENGAQGVRIIDSPDVEIRDIDFDGNVDAITVQSTGTPGEPVSNAALVRRCCVGTLRVPVMP